MPERPVIKAHHTGICVQDLEQSIQWYREILGMELVFEGDFPDLGMKIVFLKSDTIEIELFEKTGSKPVPEERLMPLDDLTVQGTKHLAFITEDIHSLFEFFKEKDVDIAVGPIESPPKDALFGFIRDPSGVLIEFLEKHKS